MDIGLKSKSLPRFRILQIGDVHYPEWQAAPAALDVKTKQLSGAILSGLSTDGFQNLLRRISRNDFLNECDAVVFVGDYTSRGDQPQMERALRHLAGLFRINPHSHRPKFHAVPGNHDVSRALATSRGMTGKFEPLSTLLKSLGFSPLPVLAPVVLPSGDSARPVQFLLTNTTLGSWEKVGLPEGVAAWIEKTTAALDKSDQSPGTSPSTKNGDELGDIPLIDASDYYDQLDTPFVSKQALLEIKESVASDEEQALPCVVGHHNILPQATPRVAPFGELLNQGEFRSTLLSLGRPVLYLHGHIHTDPVEIVTKPSVPGSKIISIGAPTLSEGVNILDIFFSRSGEPLGLMILPLRVDEHGHVVVRDQIDVPLRTLANRLPGQLAELVVNRLSNGTQSWTELRAAISADNTSDDNLEAVAMELVWCGVIRITNQSAPRQRWFLELDR